ncbi:hypothetical protein [Mycoplasma sp. 4079]|uniref:hypothetical protein n=1 Tax=Mycoplasma sp. 4079 TaxID=3398615 RepID=UPI0039FBF3B8
MIFSKCLWSKISPKINKTFIYLDSQIVKSKNVEVIQNYYEQVLKVITSNIDEKFVIVLPDLYSLYNFDLLSSKTNTEQIFLQKIDKLKSFVSNLKKLNVEIQGIIKFDNITSFAELLSRHNGFDVQKILNNETSLDETKYVDLLNTQMMDLESLANSDNQLHKDFAKIYKWLQIEYEISSVVISGLFDFLNDKQNNIHKPHIQLIKKAIDNLSVTVTQITLHEKCYDKALKVCKLFNNYDVFTKLDTHKVRNIGDYDKVVFAKNNLNFIFDPNSFINKFNDVLIYKTELLSNILNLLLISPKLFGYQIPFKPFNNNENNLNSVINWEDRFFDLFNTSIFKRYKILKYNPKFKKISVSTFKTKKLIWKKIMCNNVTHNVIINKTNGYVRIKFLFKKFNKKKLEPWGFYIY